MKPYQILLFVLSVMTCLGIVMKFFPENGIKMSRDITLQFPTFREMFLSDSIEKKDISHILDSDSLGEPDTTRARQIADSLRKIQLQLHYPDGNKTVLYSFFKVLDQTKRTGKKVRIVHYGDSQIEGDRMTSFIRNKLQHQFGGYGPGMIPAVHFVRSFSIRQSASDNFIRYTIFGKRDTTVNHSRYGMLGNFARFTPIVPDSLRKDTATHKAWLKFEKNRVGYGKTRSWSYCKMYYGQNREPVSVELYQGDQLIEADILWPTTTMKTIQWDFDKTPDEFTLKFKGKDSPEIYGLQFDSKGGLIMDNVAMRGSAGTIFTKLDRGLMKQMYNQLGVKLLVLQYGGNVMPYIKSEKGYVNYGKWFESQLYRLKSLIPGVSIIVIGPSDMSIKQKDKYVTYPYLENVRDALKQATFNAGGAYWDMYEAMGGKNSMHSWVTHDPPLAAKDYTHFSPSGVKKIAQWFYDALMEDYNEYKKQQAKQ